jgi:hypothetical protein
VAEVINRDAGRPVEGEELEKQHEEYGLHGVPVIAVAEELFGSGQQ